MNDIDLDTEFAKLIPLPDRRYRAMRLLLARQAALREAGPRHRAYFRKYKARLIADAVELIKSSPRFARYQNLLILHGR
jgi:hypothetical protein